MRTPKAFPEKLLPNRVGVNPKVAVYLACPKDAPEASTSTWSHSLSNEACNSDWISAAICPLPFPYAGAAAWTQMDCRAKRSKEAHSEKKSSAFIATRAMASIAGNATTNSTVICPSQSPLTR